MANMEKIEGGIIQDSFPFPRQPPQVAVIGSWSNFVWAPGPEIPVRQFRNGVVFDFWYLAGIGIMSRASRNALLILRRVNSVSKELDATVIKPGDIIVLGEGGKYSEFLMEATDLPVERDCSIELEVENCRYKGVALYEQGKFSRVVVFHPENLKLVPSKECVVWWRGKPFSVRLVVGESLNKCNNPKNKKENKNKMKIKSILASLPTVFAPAWSFNYELHHH